MAINRHRYAREFEKEYSKKGSAEKAHTAAVKKPKTVKAKVRTKKEHVKKVSAAEAHKAAVKKSRAISARIGTKKEHDEESLVEKTKRRLKELYYGERTYTPGHKKLRSKK